MIIRIKNYNHRYPLLTGELIFKCIIVRVYLKTKKLSKPNKINYFGLYALKLPRLDFFLSVYVRLLGWSDIFEKYKKGSIQKS
jgi:hypothetical protein